MYTKKRGKVYETVGHKYYGLFFLHLSVIFHFNYLFCASFASNKTIHALNVQRAFDCGFVWQHKRWVFAECGFFFIFFFSIWRFLSAVAFGKQRIVTKILQQYNAKHATVCAYIVHIIDDKVSVRDWYYRSCVFVPFILFKENRMATCFFFLFELKDVLEKCEMKKKPHDVIMLKSSGNLTFAPPNRLSIWTLTFYDFGFI